MTAAEALKAAWAAGIQLGIDGDDLLLEAALPPPPSVINLLLQHKADILANLAAREYESNETNVVEQTTRPPSDMQLEGDERELEQPFAARRGRVEQIDGLLLHFCVECGRFGTYGYGVRLREGQLGRWYCHEHRPQEHGETEHETLSYNRYGEPGSGPLGDSQDDFVSNLRAVATGPAQSTAGEAS